METQIFKKGDIVPQWIEKTDNYELVFDTEVKAITDNECVKLYPLTPNFDCIMRGSVIDKNAPASATGANVFLFGYGDDVNLSE